MECDIHDRYVCEYEIGPSCPREGYAPDAACTCLSGHFNCYNDCDDDSVNTMDDSVGGNNGEDCNSASPGGNSDVHVGNANGDGKNVASQKRKKATKNRGGKMKKGGARRKKQGKLRNLRRVVA